VFAGCKYQTDGMLFWVSSSFHSFQRLLTWLPAGYRNNSDGSFNNGGSNGNYWSASVTGSNGYNLNFNSGNVNPSNNNNRANGFSVRCVQASAGFFLKEGRRWRRPAGTGLY
jgi:hypothetical protein